VRPSPSVARREMRDGASRLSRIDHRVSRAALHIARLARGAPTNFSSELERVTRAWLASDRVAPVFEYPPLGHVDPDHLRTLDKIACATTSEGELDEIYRARAEELLLEARIADAVGTRELTTLARERYGAEDDLARNADDLALAWIGTGGRPSAERSSGGEVRRSCDTNDPLSLVSRLRAEIGKRKLAVRVTVKRGLSPLAASGKGVVFICEGRLIDDRATERTVLHEIEGHVLPEDRSSYASLKIFGAATARGSDDQEGYALVLEERNGFLDEGRRGELGLRHVAARAFHEGAPFVDACEILVGHGAGARDAVRIAMRAHRGGVEGRGGLGRERVYLVGYLRVRDALAKDSSLESALRAGRVSCAAAPSLLPFASAPSPSA